MTGRVAVLEVGGTHVTAARVELASASVDERARHPLAADGDRSQLLGALVDAAARVASGAHALGVAFPGPFDYDNGVCLVRHKLGGLYGVDLRRELASSLGLDPRSIRFLNDAAAFLLGEAWVGAARGHRRAIGITLGSGLGSAFVADGELVLAGRGLPPGGALHLLRFRGAPVEHAVSRNALLARYGAEDDVRVDVREVADRARVGDVRAREAFAGYASDLGEFLAPVLSAFRPSSLVVGGSIARAWELIAPALRVRLAEIAGLELAVSGRLDDAPLLGAARHASRLRLDG